jgi:ABC-2 type transport system permease protein
MNWAQLRAMLWLRWRLTRNQWGRRGRVEAVIAMVLLVLGLGAAAMGGLGGIVGGAFGLSKASPTATLAVFDLLAGFFLAFWLIGIVTDLQRSEMLDLSRLLTLPVSLRGVFLLNYLSSHFSMSLVIFAPAMLGLTLGLTLGRSLAMVLLLPLVLTFFFMITTWTYYLRGWLASLMLNKRRRRAILILIPFAIMILAQLPNFFMNVAVHDTLPTQPMSAEEQKVAQAQRNAAWARRGAMVMQIHRYAPPLWLGYGARCLAEGDNWPAVWGTLGMFGIGACGLAAAYRSTLRFYLGGKAKGVPVPRPTSPTPVAEAGTRKRLLVERKVPAVPEEAGALATATLRSLLRAPEVKLALVTNVIIIVFLGATMLFGKNIGAKAPDEIKPVAPAVAAALAMMGLAQLMFNHFGFDRTGFRSLVLLATPRRQILLGKNLALLPIGFATFVIYLAIASVLMQLRVWDIAAGVLEFVAAFLVVSVLGNLASILVPYRIAAGSMRPTKTRFLTSVSIFVSHMFFPLALLPVFVPAGLGLLCGHFKLLPAAAVALTCSVLLVALAGVFYWRTLAPLGDLLQRREQRILEVVTREVE